MPEYDWSGPNVDKSRYTHGVEPDEVEEALEDPRGFGIDAYNLMGERRWGWGGAIEEVRLLQIFFAKRGGKVRPISARDAEPHHSRRYWRNRR